MNIRSVLARREAEQPEQLPTYYGDYANYSEYAAKNGRQPEASGDSSERAQTSRTRKIIAGMAAASAFTLWGLHGFPMPGGESADERAGETVQIVDGQTDPESVSEPQSRAKNPPATGQAGRALACEQKLQDKPDVRKKLEASVRANLKNYVTKRGLAPGAVAAVGCGETILAAVGVGTRDGNRPTSAAETPYDLSSVSKHITALGILALADQGKLDLNDPVSKYLKSYTRGAKDKVTFNHLLRHTSGQVDPPVSQGFYTPLLAGSKQATFSRIVNRPLAHSPGAGQRYSNSGYVVLYEAGSAAAGKPLKDVVKDDIFQPMGLKHSGVKGELSDCAPTSLDRDKSGTVMCESQDRLARALGGYSGHAGWLMSAADLASIGGMEAEGGMWKGKRILSENAIKQLTTGGRRGAGTLYNRGGFYSSKFSPRAAGHTGYNGAEIAVDPSGLYSAIIMNGTYHRSAPGGAAYTAFQAVNNTLAKTVNG